MCLTGGFLEVRRLFHLSGAPHRSGYDRKVKKTDCSRKLKRVWVGTSGGFGESGGPWIVRSASVGPENSELG